MPAESTSEGVLDAASTRSADKAIRRTVLTLPDEILDLIIQRLSARSRLRLSLTCRRFYSLISVSLHDLEHSDRILCFLELAWDRSRLFHSTTFECRSCQRNYPVACYRASRQSRNLTGKSLSFEENIAKLCFLVRDVTASNDSTGGAIGSTSRNEDADLGLLLEIQCPYSSAQEDSPGHTFDLAACLSCWSFRYYSTECDIKQDVSPPTWTWVDDHVGDHRRVVLKGADINLQRAPKPMSHDSGPIARFEHIGILDAGWSWMNSWKWTSFSTSPLISDDESATLHRCKGVRLDEASEMKQMLALGFPSPNVKAFEEFMARGQEVFTMPVSEDKRKGSETRERRRSRRVEAFET
jgi:F-box domain